MHTEIWYATEGGSPKKFGTRLIEGDRRSKSWWNSEIEQLVRERARHFKRVRRSPRELIAER